MKFDMKAKTLVAALAMALGMGAAQAEVGEVTLAYQFGWSYTTLRVMEKQNLVEKHAKAAGIDLKANYKNMGTPAVIRDGMLAGQVNFGAVGVPTLITLADKTNGEFKALGNIVSVPMNFNVNVSANVTNICDMKGKIALPTVKSSVQAVTLQMAAKQKCGDALKLDANTVSMTHPDAMSALLNGQVDAHLTSPPFNDLEVSVGAGKVKTLFDSYSVLGGPTSFILLVGNEKFRAENPKVTEAVSKAFEEATAWVREHKKEAAELYVKEEKSKESVAEVLAQMSAPTTIFDTTPNRIGVYSNFMKEIGTVKREMDWKFLSMPNLHGRNGS